MFGMPLFKRSYELSAADVRCLPPASEVTIVHLSSAAAKTDN